MGFGRPATASHGWPWPAISDQGQFDGFHERPVPAPAQSAGAGAGRQATQGNSATQGSLVEPSEPCRPVPGHRQTLSNLCQPLSNHCRTTVQHCRTFVKLCRKDEHQDAVIGRFGIVFGCFVIVLSLFDIDNVFFTSIWLIFVAPAASLPIGNFVDRIPTEPDSQLNSMIEIMAS